MIKQFQFIEMTKYPFIILLYLLVSLTSANAYIDPGTGSFIIQSILAFIAAVGFYLGYPLRFIKSLFKKKKKKKKKKKNIKKNYI